MNLINSGLKIARESAGMNIVEVATKLNVDVSVVKSWEAGGGMIPLNTIIKRKRQMKRH